MSLYTDACRYIPGGVNSPVRAFRGVGGEPIFLTRAQGAHVWAADGRQFIDYVGSWGPMILGHAHPEVIRAVQDKAADGLSFGAPTEIETTLARRICELVPSIELVRMVSSGTEATMSAIRLARGHTHRNRIIKFEGCYHGHSDSLLVKAGSGALTLGVPTSPGVPPELAAHTVTLSYNDIAQLRAAFAEIGPQVACAIVEPRASIPRSAGWSIKLKPGSVLDTRSSRRSKVRQQWSAVDLTPHAPLYSSFSHPIGATRVGLNLPPCFPSPRRMPGSSVCGPELVESARLCLSEPLNG